MSESEILERILSELQNIRLSVLDLKAAVESSFDMYGDRLQSIEAIAESSRSLLESINNKD